MTKMLRFTGLIVAMTFALSTSVMSHAREAVCATHSPDAENFPRPFTFTAQLRVTNEAYAFGRLDPPLLGKHLCSGDRDLTMREIVKWLL